MFISVRHRRWYTVGGLNKCKNTLVVGVYVNTARQWLVYSWRSLYWLAGRSFCGLFAKQAYSSICSLVACFSDWSVIMYSILSVACLSHVIIFSNNTVCPKSPHFYPCFEVCCLVILYWSCFSVTYLTGWKMSIHFDAFYLNMGGSKKKEW